MEVRLSQIEWQVRSCHRRLEGDMNDGSRMSRAGDLGERAGFVY